MRRHLLLQVLLILVLSACGSVPNSTPATVPGLPDLAVSTISLGMRGVPSSWTQCVPAYDIFEIRAMIRNLGQEAAYNVGVSERSTGTALTIGELGAGQGMELYFPATSPNATYTVDVDPAHEIHESNEGNNTLSYLAVTPTPPVLCTAMPTPSIESSMPLITGGLESVTLSPAALLNGIYHSPDWGEFQVKDGIYYRTPPTTQESPESYTTRIVTPIIYGDINADGLAEALVFLNTQNGGSGHFIEMAAVIDQGGMAYNVSTIGLGDRVVVEAGKVVDGTIVLDMRVHAPNDGLCCPSQFVTLKFVLEGDRLVKVF